VELQERRAAWESGEYYLECMRCEAENMSSARVRSEGDERVGRDEEEGAPGWSHLPDLLHGPAGGPSLLSLVPKTRTLPPPRPLRC